MSRLAEAASRQQSRALDPKATVWVEASAGSGKTKVLVDRCLGLLLSGTAPERLLCITFTKAAASEMANRLMQALQTWVAEETAALETQLEALLGRHPRQEETERARQLLALVLDTPSGLKVQTLHSFCQSVLSRFPLEAGTAPGFATLDERSAAELMAAAYGELVTAAGREPEIADALEAVLTVQGESGLEDLQQILTAERDRLIPMLSAGYGLPLAALAKHLGLPRDADPEQLWAEGLSDAALPRNTLPLVVQALNSGTERETEAAQDLQAFLALPEAKRAGETESYLKLFLAGEVRDRRLRARLLTKNAEAAVPEARAAMAAEGARLLALEERRLAAQCLRLSAANLRLAERLLSLYRERKRAAAALDYQDMLQLTAELLARPGAASWVLFKLDGGLAHVLIDEAQDTSPLQWQILKALTEEFYSGDGAAEEIRSVFAVGDAKQSIYSFQGADPAGFEDAARHFRAKAEAAGLPFRQVPLTHSFRSLPAVLACVDAVFQAAAPLTAGPYLPHRAIRAEDGGLVALQARRLPEEAAAPAWALPVIQESAGSPAAALAEALAGQIAGWLGDPALRQPGGAAWLAARGRLIEAGDILILVRRRGLLFHAMARALERRGLPVAGIDRMLLSQQLAVMDLCALLQVLLLPEDDLSLACLLKGPLYGLDDDDLFRLAHGRKGSLWRSLQTRREEEPAWLTAAEELRQLRGQIDFLPPFELLSQLLGARSGRRRLCARLGEECNDPLDELLALALAYEGLHPPSLQGFLGWLGRSEVVVKRDLEEAGSRIRLMTVHGAKGLQAPVVILPDSDRQRRQAPAFQIGPDFLLRRIAGCERIAAVAALADRRAEAAAAEERRLLYVALTRAEDRLYLLGTGSKDEVPKDCWYDLLQQGLKRLTGAEAAPAEYSSPQRRPALPAKPKAVQDKTVQDRAAEDIGALPDWAKVPPAKEPEPWRPFMPSRLPEPPALSPLRPNLTKPGLTKPGLTKPGLLRGRLVHRLLQLLPDLPAEARAPAARQFLAQAVYGLTPGEQEEMAAETLAAMGAPEAAALFGPHSRAEVPLVGLAGRRPIAGRIDRLAVTDEAVLLLDYKTDRPAPRDPAAVPKAYLQQLAGYALLLRGLYPDRPLHCFLLWTEQARLMRIGNEWLEQAGPLTLSRDDR
ncbi:MAG: double-strand break repair helicase AddA [Rhodospirillales bacterium]|nr:double-strand break repair helicase AddA [Rhodospirillales bacterium]